MTVSRERLNAWAKLQWRDPAVTLADFRAQEINTAGADVSDRVRRLRTNDMRSVREGRDAALFTHGLAAATGNKVYFASSEESDYDFVTSWIVGDQRHFCAVQLKELPPSDLASNQSLKTLLGSLGKYQRTDTVLAVLLNQPSQLRTEEIPRESIPFSQVWLFWCKSPDQQTWTIQGDILNTAEQYEFTYPVSWDAA